jgi:hypothetical protein
MMARSLGQRAHNVRDVRCTVRQSMWAASVLVLPIWLVLFSRDNQDRNLRQSGSESYPRLLLTGGRSPSVSKSRG